MFKSSNNTRSLPLRSVLTAVGTVLIGSLFSYAQAQTGTWSGPIYDVSGRTPSNTAEHPNVAPPGSEHQPIGGGGAVAPSSPSWVANPGGPLATGTVHATFTYHPDTNNPSDVAPKYVGVLEHASASWSRPQDIIIGPLGFGYAPPGKSHAPDKNGGSQKFASFHPSHQPHFILTQSNGGGSGGSGSVSDGMGDPAVSTQDGAISQGFHYHSYPVVGNTVVTSAVTPSASTSADNGGTLWSYSAALNDHSIYVSSDIEVSYKRLSVGQGPLPEDYYQKDSAGNPILDTNGQPVLDVGEGHKIRSNSQDGTYAVRCERSSDGSMTVESAATWIPGNPNSQLDPDTTDNWYGGAILTSHQNGFSIPAYSWTLSGGAPVGDAPAKLAANAPVVPITAEELGDTGSTQTFRNGINLAGSPSQLQTTQSTVNLTVNETDTSAPQVTASSSPYMINWHMPREHWQNYGPTTSIWAYPSITVNSPGYGSMGGGVNTSYDINGDAWGSALGTTYSALTSLLSTIPMPYSTLAAAAGLVHIGPEHADNVPVIFNDQWGSSSAVYQPYRDDSLKNQYQMVPQLRVGYVIKLWDGECYDTHGYSGQEKKATETRDGREEWVATFTLQNPPVGGGH